MICQGGGSSFERREQRQDPGQKRVPATAGDGPRNHRQHSSQVGGREPLNLPLDKESEEKIFRACHVENKQGRFGAEGSTRHHNEQKKKEAHCD